MKRGFTLLELLIVITIVCMLTAIAIPGFQKATARQRVAAATAARPAPFQPQQVPQPAATEREGTHWHTLLAMPGDVEFGLKEDGSVVWRRIQGYK